MAAFLPTGHYIIVPFKRGDVSLPVEGDICATAPALNAQLRGIFDPNQARDGVFHWLVSRIEEDKPVYNIWSRSKPPPPGEVSTQVMSGWIVEGDAVVLATRDEKWEITPIIHRGKQTFIISAYREVGIDTRIVEMENTFEKKIRVRITPILASAETEDSDINGPVDLWHFIPIPSTQE